MNKMLFNFGKVMMSFMRRYFFMSPYLLLINIKERPFLVSVRKQRKHFFMLPYLLLINIKERPFLISVRKHFFMLPYLLLINIKERPFLVSVRKHFFMLPYLLLINVKERPFLISVRKHFFMLPYLLLINIKERPFYHEVFLSILNFFKTLPNLFSSLKGKTINFHIISLTLLFFVFQPVMPSLANKLDQRKISQEDISYLFDESNIDLENNDSLILALSEEEMQELEGKSLIASTFKTLGSIGSIFIRFSPTANAILVEAVTDIKAVLAMTTNYIYRYNNFITTEQEVYEVVIERIKELSEQIGSIESVQPSEELIAYRDTIIKPELERVESDSSLILVTSPNFKHYQLEEKVLSRKKLDAHIEVKEIIDAYLSKDYLTGEFKSFVRDFGEDISFIDLLKVYTGFENLVDISIVLREEIHNRDLSDEAYLDLLVATLKISQLAQNDIDVILSRNPDDEKALKAQKLLKVASNRDLLAEQLNGKKQNLVEAEDYVRIYSMGTEEAQARIAEGHIDKSEKEIGIMEYDFKIDTIDSELKKIQNEIKDIQTINYQLRKEYSELESRSEN